MTESEYYASLNAGTVFYTSLPVTSGAIGTGHKMHLLGLFSDVLEPATITAGTGAVVLASYAATLLEETSTDDDLFAKLNARIPLPSLLPASSSGFTTGQLYHFLNLESDPLTGTEISCGVGAITVAAYTAGVLVSTEIACTLGTIDVAALTATITQPVNVDIACTLGTIAVAAHAATIHAGTDIDCSLGTVAVASYAATIQADTDTDIACTLGAITVTGHRVQIRAYVDLIIPCTLGTIAVTGLTATINAPHTIRATLGTLVVAAYDAAIASGAGNWIGVVEAETFQPGALAHEVYQPGATEYEVRQ